MKTTTSIYKRKDGRYEARYKKGLSADGHVIYGSVYGKTKEEVKSNLCEKGLLSEEEQHHTCELNLLILGAGSHGNDVKEVAESLHIFNKIKYLDDKVEGEDVIGKCKDASSFLDEYACAFVAIGDNRKRKKLTNFLENCGFRMPSIISPGANISPKAEIGYGVAILPGSTINEAKIGNYVILEPNSFVGRDAVLGSYSRLDCGSMLPKNSKAKESTWLKNGEIYRVRIDREASDVQE